MKKLCIALLGTITLLQAEIPINLDGNLFLEEYNAALITPDNPAKVIHDTYLEDDVVAHKEALESVTTSYLEARDVESRGKMKPLIEKGYKEQKFMHNVHHKNIFKALWHLFASMKRPSDGPEFTPVTPETMPQLHSALETLAQRLEIPMPLVFVTSSDFFNAKATTQDSLIGCSFITQNMLQRTSDGQTLSVMAHEFGHIKNNDIERKKKLTKRNVLVSGALSTLLYAVLKNKTKIEDPLIITLVSFVIMAILAGKHTNRQIEREADAHSAHAHDPTYGAQAFRKFNEIAPQNGSFKKALLRATSSHPVHEDRVAFFEQEAARQKAAQTAA